MTDAVGGTKHLNGVNGHTSSYASRFNLPSHFIGGNELSGAPPSKVKDFVTANDGHTVITNVRTSSHFKSSRPSRSMMQSWQS